MFCCDMLLHKCVGLEQLVARFASEFPFVFLLDMWLDSFRQFPTTIILINTMKGMRGINFLLVIILPSILLGINGILVDK